MKSSLSFVSETAAQKKEVILRAAVSKPKEVPVSRAGRRVEQTIRDEDLIFIYQNAKSYWVETEESLFALKYRGADRDCRSGVVSQSLAVHILEDQIGSEKSAEHDTLETITLALTKAYQYALMYPTLKFAMSELGFPKGFDIKKDEVIFNLKSAPSNLILSGEWQNIREKQLGLKKSARLVISGTALGVNNSFVYEEIEEEIAYLRDEGFTEITLFHFGLYGGGSSRGDIRIPVACAKLMKDVDVDFYRITFDREGYENSGHDLFAYLNAWAATHVLHFQPAGSKDEFDYASYYESRGISCRELLLSNQQANTINGDFLAYCPEK